MSLQNYEHILSNKQFHNMVYQRSRLSWILTTLMLITYYSFIIVIAFSPHLLGIPIYTGSTITWGIALGLFIILFTFFITGIYVHRANTYYDKLLEEVVDTAKLRDDSL